MYDLSNKIVILFVERHWKNDFKKVHCTYSIEAIIRTKSCISLAVSL